MLSNQNKQENKYDKLISIIFKLILGILLLAIWYILEGPKNLVNQQEYPNGIGYPSTVIGVNVMSWLTIIGSVISFILALMSFISLLIKRKQNLRKTKPN